MTDPPPTPQRHAEDDTPVYSPEHVVVESAPSSAPPDHIAPKAKVRPGFRQPVFGWTADYMLDVLQSLSDNDLELIKKNVLCNMNRPDIVVFYANPVNSPHGRLRVEQEIIESTRLADYSDKVFFVPVTTKTSFARYLARFKPPNICFVGHCDENYVAFCDDTNKVDPVPLELFASMMAAAYDGKSPDFVGLFACKTKVLASLLFENSPCPGYVMYWNGLTEDRACRQFGQFVMKRILHHDTQPVNLRAIFDESVNELRQSLQSAGRGFGEPENFLHNWDEHRQKFKEAIQARLDSAVDYRTVFYPTNPELDYEKRRLSDCRHCDPKVVGVPALRTKGQVVREIVA